HLLPLRHHAVVRALPLRSGDRADQVVVRAGARAAIGLGARVPHVPGLGPRAAPGLARRDGEVMRAWLLGPVQASVALLLAPGLVGASRWMNPRLQTRRGSPPWQPYRELPRLFAKAVVGPNHA